MAKSPITASERKTLYTKIYNVLGATVRNVQITDAQMDTLYENALEDYSRYINEWLVDQQWSTISGLNIEDSDFSVAFSTKDLTFAKSFSYAYSKQVGLGTNAYGADNWELKQDYITITANTQSYIIPKGREINEVLWYTPSTLFYNGLDSIGGFIGQEYGWQFNGIGLGSILPSYSTMLSSMDRSLKSKLIRSELTYRITGNADGTKTLHLYPVPGGPYQPSGFGTYFDSGLSGSKVWYWYYETTAKNKNKCLADNNDIAVVTRPSDAPIDNLTWGNLNSSSRTWIRLYMTASAKLLLGYIRGTFSGNINITDAQVQMDYSFLLADGRDEKDKLVTELKERLDGLTYEHQLQKRANEAQTLNTILSYSPTGIFIA
jgi:hypothetical protein